MKRNLTIGTRRSQLALWQANYVADALRRHDPELSAQLQQVVGEQHDGHFGQQFGAERLAADAALQGGKGLHAAGVDGVGVGGF